VFGSGAYRPLFLRQLYDLFPTLTWVVEADNRIVGHLCSAIGLDRDTGWIVNAGVLARYRRYGIGSHLLKHGMDQLLAAGAKRVKITADVSNQPAIHLYAKLGFREIGTEANYYGDGHDRLIFVYEP
jgi:ribosomal protein S18 acetylase RimI-like enzyme